MLAESNSALRSENRRVIIRVLASVAVENPGAIRFAAQLLGVPACPVCDFVMRPGHVCAVERGPRGALSPCRH